MLGALVAVFLLNVVAFHGEVFGADLYPKTTKLSDWSAPCCSAICAADKAQSSAPTGCKAPLPGVQITQVDKAALLKLHNDARQLARPGMKNLVWDDNLACVAMRWAMQSTENHDTYADRSLICKNYTYVGQNLANASPGFTLEDLVGSDMGWISEKSSYDYASNTCAAGADCGHYTQVVWADTVKVGCGRAFDPNPNNSDFGGAGGTGQDTLICNYGPAGNIDGQKPY